MARPRLIVTMADYNAEISTVTLGLAAPGFNFADWLDDVQLLEDRMAAVSIGLRTKREIVASAARLAGPGAVAASVDAQRETKWLVRMIDGVNAKTFTFEIPMANLSLLQPNSDLMNVASGAGANLAFSLNGNTFRSPWGNNATLIDIRHVGRNI